MTIPQFIVIVLSFFFWLYAAEAIRACLAKRPDTEVTAARMRGRK